MNWKSVEMPPEIGAIVLVIARQRPFIVFHIGLFCGQEKLWLNYETGDKIFPTHWMPLPEVPQ